MDDGPTQDFVKRGPPHFFPLQCGLSAPNSSFVSRATVNSTLHPGVGQAADDWDEMIFSFAPLAGPQVLVIPCSLLGVQNVIAWRVPAQFPVRSTSISQYCN